MQATQDEIEILFLLQDLDLQISAKNKEFESLPQRNVIKEAREKRILLEEKLSKIELLLKDAKKRLTSVEDEDASLQKKERGVQAAIEAAGNDFRNAESRSKELDGIVRRRGDIAPKMEEIKAEIKKIEAMQKQVVDGLSSLDKIESEATSSFKEEGSALMKSISEMQSRHDALLNDLSADLAQTYETVSDRFNETLSIAKLEGSACSACRTKMEPGRVIDLKNQAPVTTCPACKRILIIE